MSLPETGVKLVAENEDGFFRAMTRAGKSVDDFEGTTQRASVGTIAFGTAIGNLITGGLSMVARVATQAGQAIAGFVGQGINEAAALEAQMSGIAAVTGASADEMEALNSLILDLGLDPNLTVSTVEAAQAIEMLGKNGVSVTDILDGMALQTVRLANSTGADFATAADLATDVMSAFSAQGVNMEDAVNGITAVVNSSKFDINDYALALANGGAAVASMGGDLDGFNALLSQTAFTFSSGATAGTALKNMLRRLVPATNKAEEEMQALGLITAEGNNLFFDAEGNMKSVSEVAALLSSSLGGLSEMQRTQAINTIFGAEAAEAVNATITAGLPIYTDATQAMNDLGLSWEDATRLVETGGNQIALAAIQMEQVDAGQSAATRVDNFAGAMDILGGVIEGVRIQIGDKFLPVLTDLARKAAVFAEENAGPFIDAFGRISDAIGFVINQVLAGNPAIITLSGALATLGVPNETINKIREIALSIQDFIDKTVAFVTEHKDTFIGAIKGIGVVLAGAAIAAGIATIGGAIAALASPIGIIVAAAGVLGAAWENNWGGIQEKTQAVIDFITPYIETAITNIKTFWNENGASILGGTQKVWESVKTAVNDAMVFIRDNVIVPVATAIAQFWAEHGETIMTNAAKTWNFIKFFLSTAFDNLKTAFSLFKSAFEGDWKSFGENLRILWDNAIKLIVAAFETWGRDFLTKVSTFITDFIDKFGKTDWNQVGINIIQGIIDGIMGMRQAFINAATNVASAGLEATKGFFGIDSPSKVFMGIGRNLGGSMAMGMASESGAVSAAAGALGGAAVNGAIMPPASPAQIMNNTSTVNNSTVNFTGNFATDPTITDRDALIRTMATV